MERNVVSFNYVLKNKSGEVLDQTGPGQAMTFLEGSQTIIPGLERQLLELDEGQEADLVVRPEEGYGFRDESQIGVVSKSKLPVDEVKVGDYFRTGADNHAPVVQVVKVDDDEVTLDANHPLAGQDLFFSVQVLGKRAATEEEIAHGHAHSQGGGCCGGEGGGGCGCS